MTRRPPRHPYVYTYDTPDGTRHTGTGTAWSIGAARDDARFAAEEAGGVLHEVEWRDGPRVGQPPLATPRTHQVSVRLTDAERARAVRMATEAGCSVTAVVQGVVEAGLVAAEWQAGEGNRGR
jgi:hypothetical protein